MPPPPTTSARWRRRLIAIDGERWPRPSSRWRRGRARHISSYREHPAAAALSRPVSDALSGALRAKPAAQVRACYASFEAHGIRVVVSPFVTPGLWRVLYRRGFWIRKLAFGVWGPRAAAAGSSTGGRFDFVYVHLWALPFGPPWFEEHLTRRGVPVIHDIDDLIYLPRASAANLFVRAFRRRDRIVRIMRAASTSSSRPSAPRAVCRRPQHSRDHDLVDHRHRRVSAATAFRRARRRHDRVERLAQHRAVPRRDRAGASGVEPPFHDPAAGRGGRALRDGGRRRGGPGLVARTRDGRPLEMDIGVYSVARGGMGPGQERSESAAVWASAYGRRLAHRRRVRVHPRRRQRVSCGIARGMGRPDIPAHSRSVAARRMGLAGRATVEEGFSVRRTAPVYLQVIESVLDRDQALTRSARSGKAGSERKREEPDRRRHEQSEADQRAEVGHHVGQRQRHQQREHQPEHERRRTGFSAVDDHHPEDQRGQHVEHQRVRVGDRAAPPC